MRKVFLSFVFFTLLFLGSTLFSNKVQAGCNSANCETSSWSWKWSCSATEVCDWYCQEYGPEYCGDPHGCWQRGYCWSAGCTPSGDECWSGGCDNHDSWCSDCCQDCGRTCYSWGKANCRPGPQDCSYKQEESCNGCDSEHHCGENGSCVANAPPSPCGGPCTPPEVCNIDLKRCVNPNAGTQGCGQQTCGAGQQLRCSPDCNSASPQCYCEGAASQECSGGNTSSCGVNPTCPINQGPGYWVCNGGRCETVCRASSPSNESCTPRAASCTYCWSGSQQCDNGCNTWTQDCATGCTASKPQKPIAISPSGTTTAINVAFKYKSFANLAEWGAFCPINTNSYTYYLNEESSPTLSTQRGTPYVSNPPYQNNYCGGTYPCDIVSPMFAVLYGRSYKWKVTACNGAGSCTDSDIMHFTVRDAPGWWQTVGGGDVYGLDVQSEIGEKASPALIILN